MARSSFSAAVLFALSVVSGANAQQASAYTDANTGITFQAFQDDSGFQFGMALPETPGSDFIGQLIAPLTDADSGWAGVSLSQSMTGPLLIAAWVNEDDIVASFRQASGYTNPSVFVANGTSSPTMSVIPEGTMVNSTSMTYTFLCQNCLSTDLETIDLSTESTGVLGWALSTDAVSDATDSATALNYHAAGFGAYGMTIADAQSAEYDTWAAMASASTSTSSPVSGSNGTTGSSGSSRNTTTPTTTSNSTYDYIVAGAGAAGIIVAERLAESGASVLLIERGNYSTASTGGQAFVSWNDSVTPFDVPSMSYYLTDVEGIGSAFCTDVASEAGCALGGGTVINAMMYVKPQKIDFDDKWPAGWKWDDVASDAANLYERNPGTITPSSDGKYYDQGAYDIVSNFLSANGWSTANALEDVDEKYMIYSHPPWNIQDGLRAGPVMNYLPLAEAYSNFNLQLNSFVVRAVRNGSSVSGVEVELASGEHQIINLKAGGKVILAAGALSTPRILFNSGIGPSAQIQTVANGSTGVTLPARASWIDLPVGDNLQDHPIFTVVFNTTLPITAMAKDAFTEPNSTDADMFARQSGPLVQSGQRLNFWSSVDTSDSTTRYVQGTVNSPSPNTIRMKIYLTHGLTSSGTLGIASDGATQFTKDPWMNTDEDKEAMTTFLDQLLSYTQASNSTLLPSPANVTSADIIADYVTGSHFVGTARMGTANDGSSVVDTDTKVWGTDNLYVVDASMHPDLPTGNTQAMVYVAAEAAARKILGAGRSNSTAPGSSTTPIPEFPSYPNAGADVTPPWPTARPSSCKRRKARARS